jgi:predicted phosphodiesterase
MKTILATALTFSLKHKGVNTSPFQYCSDVHVDIKATKKIRLDITPTTKTLMVAGDIGNPFCPSFESFFGNMSNIFETVLFVPGNHDHNNGCVFRPSPQCKDRINAILRPLPNVHLLDNKIYDYSEDTIVVGTQLYSLLSPALLAPKTTLSVNERIRHNYEHSKCVDFIEYACRTNPKKNVIVMSHYVPTFRLIDDKYKKWGASQSKWTTDLEDVMAKHDNLCVWICGHTHSVKKVEIKHASGHSTICMVNAIG